MYIVKRKQFTYDFSSQIGRKENDYLKMQHCVYVQKAIFLLHSTNINEMVRRFIKRITKFMRLIKKTLLTHKKQKINGKN